MQCRKQALLRYRRNYEDELKEEKRTAQLSYKSDGLKNVSLNLLGKEFNEAERRYLLATCLSVCLSVYLSVRLSVCLCVCASVRLSVCLTVCPSVRLSVHQSYLS